MEARKNYRMVGKIKLRPIGSKDNSLFVHKGPLLTDIDSQSNESIQKYEQAEGYRVFRKLIDKINSEDILIGLDQAKLRGRGGGGYPAAHKWWLVYKNKAEKKYFICNANSGTPGGFKESYLIDLNPHRVIEAVATGALVVGANTAIISLPPELHEQAEKLRKAVEDARESNLLGKNILGSNKDLDILVYETLGSYIVGEETALLEILEGRVGQPRGKPSLPTEKGLFGQPSCINNLETVLQAHYIIKEGVDNFKKNGTSNSYGTILISLSGNIKRPGIYEVPLGTELNELIFEYGLGVEDDLNLLGVLPGGISSNFLLAEECEVGLDFDSLRDVDSDLGSGSVIVVSNKHDVVNLATHLSKFYHDVSCGKCLPCKQGNHRTTLILENLDKAKEKSIDRMDEILPKTKRTRSLNVIQPMGGISYTDTVEVTEKIPHLCEFYKYRGDCHHSTESASSIQTIYKKFYSVFEKAINNNSETAKEDFNERRVSV